MKNSEHKQYLIDSIGQMETFVANLTDKINASQNNSGAMLKTMWGIVARKKENIQQFKDLLRTQYNHSI